MAVEVEAPSDCAAALLRDLHARSGQIKEQDVRVDAVVVRAEVPLANIFGYANRLRDLSRDRATSTMRFDHYAPVALPHDDPPFAPAVGMRA
jgi:elongation factor G